LTLMTLALLVLPAWSFGQQASPVIPGLSGRHPLEERAVGTLLLEELRCASCHHQIPEVAPAAKGPDLADVGSRVAPQFLRRFLADPRATQPGTKMPDLMHALPADERDEIAEALTHFLVSQSPRSLAAGSFAERAVARGEDLFHTVGCVACHAPGRPPELSNETPRVERGSVDLGHVSEKYGVAALSEFLFQPGLVRPAGRMPDLGLSRAEARDLACYLIGVDRGNVPPLRVEPARVAAGRQYFEAYSCAACHPLDGVQPSPSVPIGDPRGGCLDPEASEGVSFSLNESQRAALLSALSEPAATPSAEQRIASTLTAFNCIGCHVREDYGGVPPDLDPYFTTDEHDLGDDARLPPPLTLTGAKLQGEWMRKVIFDGASVRDYMFTRMPRFGEANLAHLPELLERADSGRVEPFEMPLPEGEEARIAREAGRELMGVRGLGCIACHDFNGTPSPTHEGVDLINSTIRLRPDWFARFLIDPQGYRPGVVMPESWSGGIAAHTGILAGDTEAQIQALWYYLSQGRTARDPDGIRPAPSRLSVGDTTRTYRGRSRVAGYRGIAVGYPGGLNYAFDAQTGTLSALWRGDFVTVRWDSQGAGDFHPDARAVQLAQDVSFVRLADAASPWPLRPVTTEEAPINPDPSYPRNHGYRFRGYEIGRDSVPSFRYASGAVEITDRSEADLGGDRAVLRRTLTFTAPAAETLYFRLLTGNFEAVSEHAFQTRELLLRLPDAPFLRRPSSADDGSSELLLQLDLPRGDSSITIDYELLD